MTINRSDLEEVQAQAEQLAMLNRRVKSVKNILPGFIDNLLGQSIELGRAAEASRHDAVPIELHSTLTEAQQYVINAVNELDEAVKMLAFDNDDK